MFFWVTTPYRLVGDYQREEGHAVAVAVFRVETLQEEYLEHDEVKLKVEI
jgi:hypothetical protein